MHVRAGGRQDGVAMITVMMVMVVLSLLMVAALGYAVQSEPLSRRDQDWNAALAAAQAGVDDYAYRLQQDANYYNYSRATPPTPANPAFTGWVTVPGPASQGQFHYEPFWSSSQGNIKLISTGRVRGVQRTIQVILRRSSFLEYLYLTDYESLDPESGYYSNPTSATSQCSKYWWQGRPNPPTCVRISFVTGDVIDGPMHSNDTISVNGSPQFKGKATSGWSGTMSCAARAGYSWRWYGLDGCNDRPQFLANDPTFDTLTLPTTNSALKVETDRSVGKTGCLYTGPTRITLKATGKMDVTSPFTSTTGAYANCVGNDVALPSNGVIFAQNVPSGQSVTCPSSGNRLNYPVSNDITEYDCRVGDVFLSGILKGQLTIGAENNIVIVGDTSYATSGSASTDMLGVIAANFVQVYHPVRRVGSSYQNITPTWDNPRIDAAILALNHSFIVQNYDKGADLGTITVNGVIAQKWRGPVGTSGSGGSGYLKDYNYDQRLKHASPPHALSPFETEFKVNQWAETGHPPRCGTPPVSPCLP